MTHDPCVSGSSEKPTVAFRFLERDATRTCSGWRDPFDCEFSEQSKGSRHEKDCFIWCLLQKKYFSWNSRLHRTTTIYFVVAIEKFSFKSEPICSTSTKSWTCKFFGIRMITTLSCRDVVIFWISVLSLSNGISVLSRKYFLLSVTESVKWFLLVDSDAWALGSQSFMTFGLAKVEMIKKNNSKKNMISLKDDVGISAWKRRLRLMAMLRFLNGVYNFKHLALCFERKTVNCHVEQMIGRISNDTHDKSCARANHFFV